MFQPIVVQITMEPSYARLHRRMWTADNMAFRVFDDKLINELEIIPVIYNNRLKEFRNSTAKENVWRLYVMFPSSRSERTEDTYVSELC